MSTSAGSLLSSAARDLLSRRVVAVVGTTHADGRPHLTPVWFELDGDVLRFNTTEQRLKFRHLSRDPRVTILVVDPESMYRYVQAQGVARLVREGADETINRLSQAYTGHDFTIAPGSTRITVEVELSRIEEYGLT